MLAVILLPSGFTPPNVVVVEIGNEYCGALITPLLVTVIVIPSGFTPPKTDAVAIGRVYVPGAPISLV